MTSNFMSKISNAAKNIGLKIRPITPAGKLHVTLQTGLSNVVGTNRFRKVDATIYGEIKIRNFHVSSPKYALPPVLVILFRYIARAGAMISGKLIRKWWQRLSPEEKEKILKAIRARKSKIAMAGTIFIGGIYLYYLEHIVEDPITKRKRFIMLSQKQINQIAEFEYENQLLMFRSDIVPTNHPVYRRVVRVANNLLLSNKNFKEVRDKTWTVTVVDRPEITNAFALPHGKIFVFTGMLNVCTNDDQLAIVLAHEISHSILSHVAESMSKVFFIEFILLIPTLFLWSIFPDMWAIFSQWLMTKLTSIFIHLPFSRSIEKEADVVGLQLAAKSCYDVREAPEFWAKMKIVGKDASIEWLSTHPRHETRQAELQELLPSALHIREVSNCPPLGFKTRLW